MNVFWKYCGSRWWVIVLFFACSSKVYGEPRYGAGMVLLEPEGFTFKAFLDPERDVAYEAAIGWGLGSHLYLHATYISNIKWRYLEGGAWLDFYYGVGLRFYMKDKQNDQDEARTGVRAPVGLSLLFQEKSIELFTELGVAVDVVPDTSSFLGLGLGGRFYF